MILSGVAGFVTTLIEWKRWQNGIEKSEADFREKYPPVSVTRFPIKRKYCQAAPAALFLPVTLLPRSLDV